LATTILPLSIQSGRGTQPDDAAATDRNGTVLTLGSMEVIALVESKLWLHEVVTVPPGAEGSATGGGEGDR
jgi:hypothetical protein